MGISHSAAACVPSFMCLQSANDIVVFLVAVAGADVWRHDRVRRHSALHCAAQAGAIDAVRLLLASAGTSVHPTNGKR
jgi:hypothetical protein